jgi:hypothetical protein
MPFHLRLAPALVVFSVLACGFLDPNETVEVRVMNGSEVLLDEGILHLPGDSIVFSGLQPGLSTPYQEVAQAYRIATVQVVVAQDTARLQVIDYVGETRLSPGRYTYVLSFADNMTTHLALELVEDQ